MEKRIAMQDQVAFASPSEKVNIAMPDRRSGPSVETSIKVPREITSGPIIESTATRHAVILSSHSTDVQHQKTVAGSSSVNGTPDRPVANPSRIPCMPDCVILYM